jgi:hypothetical protein
MGSATKGVAMAIGSSLGYNKKKAPNKHLVQNRVYRIAAKYLPKTCDAVMLLGGQPEKALLRMNRCVVRNRGTIYGYEYDEDVYRKLVSDKWYARIQRLLNNGYKSKGIIDVIAVNDTVAHAPTCKFEDLDFCGAFLRHRKEALADYEKHGAVPVCRDDPAMIIIDRLANQHNDLPGTKILTSNVTTRGGIGPKGHMGIINGIVNTIGWKLVSIDGNTDYFGAATGKRISTKGCKLGTRTYHAYEHEVVVCRGGANIFSRPAKTCKVWMYTYNDTQNMLTLVIKHNR